MHWLSKLTNKITGRADTGGKDGVDGSFLQDVYEGAQAGPPVFQPGPVTVSAAARQALEANGYRVEDVLACHVRCIWGQIGDEEAAQSQAAVNAGRGRAISIYALADGQGDGFFIIVSTELNGPLGTRTEVITILES